MRAAVITRRLALSPPTISLKHVSHFRVHHHFSTFVS